MTGSSHGLGIASDGKGQGHDVHPFLYVHFSCLDDMKRLESLIHNNGIYERLKICITRRKTKKKEGLLHIPEWWEEYWQGMPEFVQEDKNPWRTIQVRFENDEDVVELIKIIGALNNRWSHNKAIWFPPHDITTRYDKIWTTDSVTSPRYPIYVISKGRWGKRAKTARFLERMAIPYHLVIEPHEHDDYSSTVDPSKILMLPFSNLGRGSIPARNWVWGHSVKMGFKRHWILDDNIKGFLRLNRNRKRIVMTGAIFKAMEDFVDRYENIALAGPQYLNFAFEKSKYPPFMFNTRIYSCILIDNSLPFRWRGKYNEDTDLSLRCLKSGLCTVLFYAFLADKTGTMDISGGNTDELYQDDGRLKMAESLRAQHGDVARVTSKWGRWQHHVDYSGFRVPVLKGIDGNKPMMRKDIMIPSGTNEYGMKLQDPKEG